MTPDQIKILTEVRDLAMEIPLFEDRRDLVRRFLPNYAVCAEIGIDEGQFSDWIADVSQPARFHLIDAWASLGTLGSEGMTDERGLRKLALVSAKYQQMVRQGRAMLHQGRLPEVLEIFAHRYFDWVYIDAGHDYSEVTAELELCRTRVKPGGFIAGHDLVLDLEQVSQVKNHYGTIRRAVLEFCHKWGWEIVALTKLGPHEPPDPDGRNCPSYVLQAK